MLSFRLRKRKSTRHLTFGWLPNWRQEAAIQHPGHLRRNCTIPFRTISFRYNSPIPSKNPPQWMTQTYELCTCDARLFNHKGECVWSNLLSGDWAWETADKLAQNAQTHGSMLVPIVAGSDKMTVSVARGHQEFHPVYLSPGNLTNTGCRAHGNSVLPVAFLPIPKTNKHQAKRVEFQRFARQVYHMCLEAVFTPLKDSVSQPDIVLCPDGHFRHAIYILGPYIADYPEQVWLAGVVQGWCPKCDAPLDSLDKKNAHKRSHEHTDFIIQAFDPGTAWTEHGICSDVVPFTHSFPYANIHTTLTPDLLHQIIKGTFKDHLVEWVNQYLHIVHGESRALAIIADIDRQISAVPCYSGLRRFSEGQNFEQWTGDDLKALMKVYIAAITGYVPLKMVQCLSTFMDLCYIFRWNAITSSMLAEAEVLLKKFHTLCNIFIETGVRTSISLPRQHSLVHYITAIQLFGSPNGLCLSITESKHIKAVKEPWQKTIVWLEKLGALRCCFIKQGMLIGSTSGYTANTLARDQVSTHPHDTGDYPGSDSDDDSSGELSGPQSRSSIILASRSEPKYPRSLDSLSKYIGVSQFPSALRLFLYSHRHPKRPIPDDVDSQVAFTGKIHVYHSATARFYAPSDLCGAGGMYRQKVRCNPSWYGHPRRDTVFVVQDEDKPGMEGLLVARLHLLFSFYDDFTEEVIPCALVSWFVLAQPRPDRETGMWVVKPEGTRQHRPVQVVHLKSIARGAHLFPQYGVGALPDHISYHNSLDEFKSYLVNPYIDHHCHEFLTK
ncbi:hypothetical protein BJ165DRAFT_1571490 [Panaeolus papilionaceus]|nr:hypothetical protein BJ165DRAFT_1571490 [Panaeolus papilionaceus]